MIFAFGDDGVIVVHDDENSVRRDWEGLDVESNAVVFYADDGTWLKPVFTTPNRRQLFGLLLTNGFYVLHRSISRPPEIDGIDLALDEAVAVASNPHFDSVEAIRRHIRTRKE